MREEIDLVIMDMIGKRVEVFLQRGKYGEYIKGTLKAFDGNRVLIVEHNQHVVCFLGPQTYIKVIGGNND
jgi:hypothetical protein